MITPEENLKSLIGDVLNNEIMLPDFQRRFEWSIDKQTALIASVLTKLPVGSILLLKADSNDYKSKQIGLDSSEKVLGSIPPKTYFLLDGQQRITCLTNAFSDIIHESSGKKIRKLASQSLLTTRFYLKIDRWDANTVPSSEKDLFGVRTLDFRFDVSKGQEPDFLTAGILEKIECRYFNAKDYDKKPYMPCQRYDDKLDDYCFETQDFYLIPLFLLVGSNSDDEKRRKTRLLSILKRIKEKIKDSIVAYHANLDDDKKEDFSRTVLLDLSDWDTYINADDKDVMFGEIVQNKVDLWLDYFQSYLYSCVERIKLTKIEMPEGSRDRAIDIYENMNLGGVALSSIDLLAARVAKVSQQSLYERMTNRFLSVSHYNDSAIPVHIKNVIPADYNASVSIGAVDPRPNKSCNDLFLEVLGLYCNNKDYSALKAKASYSKSNEVLKLRADDIHENCEKICDALDRAYCFLQTRCGIRKLADVNYKLMIRLIAYIFTNDEWYNDTSVHDLLEAWYWSAVFSGEYDKDQNERYERNLKSMLESLASNPRKVDWIETLKNNVLNAPYFSDCSFLLMEKANEDRVPKEHLGRYFCQFFLSQSDSDLIDDTKHVSVFSEEELQKHHIVPLGSIAKIGELTKELRDDRTNILNSPLNFIYILESTNKAISDDSLQEYEDSITPTAKALLAIVDYPNVDDLVDGLKVKKWMTERHKVVQGFIKNRINRMLCSNH